jgi:two-component system nitrogen regulation sensor histidine kinase NtrY
MTDETSPSRPERRHRKSAIILLALAILVLFAVVFSQAAFNLTFLRPNTNEQTLLFAALSALVFLLLVALTFVLLRTLLKLYAERRGRVLGSKFRTRMVVGALVLSFAPVIFLFLFAYGLMNRSIDKWFSRPAEQVHQDTAAVANLLSSYAAENAHAEALSIARSAETQHAFASGNFSGVTNEFRRHEVTLAGGFAFAIQDDRAEASYEAPDLWPVIRAKLPAQYQDIALSRPVEFNGQEYVLGTAHVGQPVLGSIVVALPLPRNFSATLAQMERSERRYYELGRERKLVRRTYMLLLLLLTVLVLFAATWFALFLSKFVTRPVAALAAATEEISRGRFDYRVEVASGDELGRLVQSFNRMAEELQSKRRALESSSRSLAEANAALEQRRRQIEIILENTPTGVLSLDANRRVTHANPALTRMFSAAVNDAPSDTQVNLSAKFLPGAPLQDCFSPEVTADLERMLRQSDRMRTVTNQMEISSDRHKLDLAVTAASLHVDAQRLGYVIVFEDLSDLLRAQKQAAWREVARRVAHEIKNPLTPIGLSAQRILRHLERGTPDDQSLAVIHGCAETIAGAVDTVRMLVDEFSALARFPAAQPQAADINGIVQNALAMFEGRLDNIRVRTYFTPDLPKVLADPEAMKRAIANLVDNAAEALQDSLLREVQISTALLESKDGVEIVVADTGHGVSREMKEKLFLPYFSTKERGTGLGLAIVSRIVEEHHGSIRVEENLPVGARFIVELPLAPEAAASPSHAPEPRSSSTHA